MQFLLGLLALLVVGGVLFVVTHLFAWCSLKRILFIRKLLQLLKQIPGDVLLSCENNEVSAQSVDRSTGRTTLVRLYTGGPITWKGPNRRTKDVIASASSALVKRLALWMIVALPLFLAMVYLGLTQNPAFWLGCLFIAAEQAFPFRLGPDILGFIEDSI
jgi:hypothetical protein